MARARTALNRRSFPDGINFPRIRHDFPGSAEEYHRLYQGFREHCPVAGQAAEYDELQRLDIVAHFLDKRMYDPK